MGPVNLKKVSSELPLTLQDPNLELQKHAPRSPAFVSAVPWPGTLPPLAPPGLAASLIEGQLKWLLLGGNP